MKREPDYKLKKRLERMEHEKKMNRTYNRNWIICIGSLGDFCVRREVIKKTEIYPVAIRKS